LPALVLLLRPPATNNIADGHLYERHAACSNMSMTWHDSRASRIPMFQREFRMQISEFQNWIKTRYYATDSARGTAATFMWFVEEVGELATALAGKDQVNKEEEFADVLAWLCTLANINGVDLEKAIEKYTVRGVEGTK
jgi:NTP pyrophosphatase (non-canonical NTP hydrolase)